MRALLQAVRVNVGLGCTSASFVLRALARWLFVQRGPWSGTAATRAAAPWLLVDRGPKTVAVQLPMLRNPTFAPSQAASGCESLRCPAALLARFRRSGSGVALVRPQSARDRSRRFCRARRASRGPSGDGTGGIASTFTAITPLALTFRACARLAFAALRDAPFVVAQPESLPGSHGCFFVRLRSAAPQPACAYWSPTDEATRSRSAAAAELALARLPAASAGTATFGPLRHRVRIAATAALRLPAFGRRNCFRLGACA